MKGLGKWANQGLTVLSSVSTAKKIHAVRIWWRWDTCKVCANTSSQTGSNWTPSVRQIKNSCLLFLLQHHASVALTQQTHTCMRPEINKTSEHTVKLVPKSTNLSIVICLLTPGANRWWMHVKHTLSGSDLGQLWEDVSTTACQHQDRHWYTIMKL